MKDVLLYGEVGPDIDSLWLNKTIENIEDQNILLRVNSPGGDVFEGVAVSNVIKRAVANGKHITVAVDGLAASAASYMALTANRVVMNPGSSMMIHDPFALCVGTSDDLRKTAVALDKTRSSIVDLYVLKTGRTPEEVTHAMNEETWFTAKEAVEWGLADELGVGDGMPDVGTVNAKWSTHSDLLRERMKAARDLEISDEGYTPPTICAAEQPDTVEEEASEAESEEAPPYVCVDGQVYRTKHEE